MALYNWALLLDLLSSLWCDILALCLAIGKVLLTKSTQW